MRQQFNLVDVLRVEVQDDFPDLPNVVLNPSGEGGAWGWTTFDEAENADAYARLVANQALEWLEFQVIADLSDIGGSFSAYATYGTAITPAVAGTQVRASMDVVAMLGMPPSGTWHVWAQGPGIFDVIDFPDPLATGVNELPPTDLTPGADRLTLVYRAPAGALAGHKIRFRDACMVYGAAADVATSDPLSEPEWVDVTQPVSTIDIERDELDVGILNATIYDSTLDPSISPLIRPGKRARVQAFVDGEWQNLINVLLDNPSAVYEVKDPRTPANKRVRIVMVGSDAASDLANDQRPNGVATLDELPAVLLGTGVPWNINGSTDAIDPSTAVTVAVNDNASALDQVAVTRDSVLGFAWVDRNGVLQVWDRAELPATVAAELDESHYSDINIDFDVDRCFNTIYVTVVRINPGTGETEEVKFGPYVDPASVRQWRTRTAEFRVQGVDEELLDDYAADVLAANSTPSKRINSVTIPIRTVDEFEAHILRDLYDLVSLSNERGEIAGQESRVTSLKIRIRGTRDRGRVFLDLDFAKDGSVATPQVTPSPTAGGGAKTLGQLLRPVGEVTMWYGAKADIPAGWLALDGSPYDADQYPELDALLVGAGLTSGVLPNFADRFPIGAGAKALGTSGGSVETAPPTDEAVGWAVANSGGSNAPRLSEHNAHTHSTIPPWRALWFIIRAA